MPVGKPMDMNIPRDFISITQLKINIVSARGEASGF